MSHSLQVRRADAPRGVRGIVSVDGVSGRPGRLFPARGPSGKRSRRDPLPAEADWRPRRSDSGTTVCRIGPRTARPLACQGPQLLSLSDARREPSPLRDGETGKVGGTSRPRPRSSTFAPSCRRPPSSLSRRTVIRTSLRLPPRCCLVRAHFSESGDLRPDAARDPIKRDARDQERSHRPVPILRRINHDSRRRSHSSAKYRDQPWAFSISTVNDPLRCGSATVKSTLRRHSVGMR